MQRVLTIAVVFVLCLVAGCKKPDPMPGKWALYVPSGNQAPLGGAFEFKADGQCEMFIRFGGMTTKFKGSYQQKDTVLTIDGDLTTDDPGGYDSKSETKIAPVHKSERLKATGSLSDDFKTFRIYGKDFRKVD